MLVSEIANDYCTISWDNASPASSKGLLRSLRRLGRVVILPPKTGVKLYPRAIVTSRQIIHAVGSNLDRRKGRASIDFPNVRTTLGIDNSTRPGVWRRI